MKVALLSPAPLKPVTLETLYSEGLKTDWHYLRMFMICGRKWWETLQ